MRSYFNSKFGGLKINPKDHSPCSYESQAQGTCSIPALSLEESKKISKLFGGTIQRCDKKKCLTVPNTKPSGPRDNDRLLSNINIEAVLDDIERASIANKTFFKNGPVKHVPFEMSDFLQSSRSALRDLDFANLISNGFKTFCCVLNTDTWAGDGKHWVCLFGTLGKDQVQIEYFNSSGRSFDQFTYDVGSESRSAIRDWIPMLEKHNPNFKIKIKNVVTRVLQESDTECGVWCLWYIKSRLEGYPPSYFITSGITDQAMLEYARTSLFV